MEGNGIEKSVIETKSGNGKYGEFIDLSTSSRGQIATSKRHSLLSFRAGTACALERINKNINSIFAPFNEGESEERAGGVCFRRPVSNETGLKRAFTLVELIVVIVILGVLATVGFLAFANYPKQARDTVRISHLREIQEALEFYKIDNGDYPIPDNYSTGLLDGESAKIGVFGERITSQIHSVTKTPLDPQTNEPYIYKVSDNLENFELITNLEVKKDGEKEHTIKHTKVVDGPYKNETTGYTFRYVKQTWGDKNCKLPDIEVLNSSGQLIQTWAGCNSTLGNGKEWLGEDGATLEVTHGCYNYNGTVDNTKCQKNDENMKSTSSAKKYFKSVNPGGINTNGDTEFDTIWGKLYSWEEAKGACEKLWKVPSKENFIELLSYLGCNSVVFNSSSGARVLQCPGLGWKDNKNFIEQPQNNFTRLLNAPLSGWSRITSKEYLYRGGRGWLWTDYHSKFQLGFFSDSSSLEPFNYVPSNIASRVSVRCIKN